ncbi:MAG: hypothetical protein OXG05_08250 [Gammaproteobacteria bacterium]|nr:hypothetical protein [Gammaproteobacteria bacterium]
MSKRKPKRQYSTGKSMSHSANYQVIRAVFVLFLPFLASCATVYTAPDFSDYQARHKTVAILPFDVSINPERRWSVSQQQINQMASEQAASFQRALYTQYLQGQQRGSFTVEFQDISETNTLLTRKAVSGNTQKLLSTMTKSEICDALKVDAVISGEMVLTKPMGTLESIASLHFFKIPGSTNEVHVNTSIHEGGQGKLIWNYDFMQQGSHWASVESLAKHLIRSTARNFPYRK